jgi:hypothetical protein
MLPYCIRMRFSKHKAERADDRIVQLDKFR